MNLRREFDLPPQDVTFLNDYGGSWETLKDGAHWVLLHEFSTQGLQYNHTVVTTAIRIETGYPNVALDMVYFSPPLSRTDGKLINAADVVQTIAGQSFQRWSRHYTAANPYKPGEDSLETHVLAIEDWLRREFEK